MSFSSKHPRDDTPPDGGSGAAAQQYKVARAISSCTRCRSRKQKCDGELPACSACERAKVECIGFDAISKTNISRTHLHSLEQEISELRAQLAMYQSGETPDDASLRRTGSTPAFRPPTPRHSVGDLTIDPALAHAGEYDSTPRSWDSPGTGHPPHSHSHSHSGIASHMHMRRQSDALLSSPHGSPSLSSAMNPKSQALTRMVHDAALRTGHAAVQANAISAFNAPGGVGGGGYASSERGSVGYSPAEDVAALSPQLLSRHAASAAGTGAAGGVGGGMANGGRPPLTTPGAMHAAAINVSGRASSHGGSQAGKKRKAFSIPPLPPQPAVERLVAAFVDFVGVTAPMIHIPTLGRQLQKIREARDVEESDIFVVMMVLALSTMASARFVDLPDELRACSEAFHAEAMKHLDAVFEEASYVSLQAILLLVWYSLLNPEKGSIWFLVGLATRTCVDMGYHNEHNAQVDQLDALELDMRRRLFWCTYKMDRLMSGSLGRPPSIPDGFINVPLPSLLHDVDITPGDYSEPTGSNCAYKAVFVHTIKMRQLQSEILTHTFGIHGAPIPGREWADDCYERLKEWLATTPEPRGAMSNEGFATAYHNTVLLLFRPSPGHPHPDRKDLANVLASSSYIIRIYRRMQLNNRISWLWMTSHFCFMAGLSFLYAFLNMHHMGGGDGTPTLDEAAMDVESCLATLDYLSPRVPSAAACHRTMRSVSSAILDQLRAAESRAPLSSPPLPAPLSPSKLNATSNARGGSGSVLNRAPISSSRDDPLPNGEFYAPLPAVTLPYELSLLEHLFVNPMASHQKASDYTQGAKARAVAAELRNAFAGHYEASRAGAAFGGGGGAGNRSGSGSGSGAVNGVGNGSGSGAPANGSNGGGGKLGVNSQGIGPWEMAAGVKREYGECPTVEQSLAGRARRASRGKFAGAPTGVGASAGAYAQFVREQQQQQRSAFGHDNAQNQHGAGSGSVGPLHGLNGHGAASAGGAGGDMGGMLDPTLLGPGGYAEMAGSGATSTSTGRDGQDRQGEGYGSAVVDGEGEGGDQSHVAEGMNGGMGLDAGPGMDMGMGMGMGMGDIAGDMGMGAGMGVESGDMGNFGSWGMSVGMGAGAAGAGAGAGTDGMGGGSDTFDIFSFLNEGFVADGGLDGMAIWS